MLDQIPLQLDREGIKETEDGEIGVGGGIILNITIKGGRLFRASDISRKKKPNFAGFRGANLRKNKPISRDFRGKKVKFAEKLADFVGFWQEKSQNSQKNRPISRDFSRKKSIFERFSDS